MPCCSDMAKALALHLLLPKYEFPDDETMVERPPQLVAAQTDRYHNRVRPFLVLRYCPWCGTKLE